MRKYAEELVGALDRSYYNSQRDVANQTYQTNWENLQNQYKNLQDKLKRQQELSNRNFANGLVNVSDDSFSRMRGANQDLTQRGLMTSGIRNLYSQADTTKKGSDVKELLGSSGNVAIDIANQLSEANQKYAANQAELDKNLGDALGEIGSAETAAQMTYNKGLADIIGAAEERKAANAAAAASIGKTEEEKAIEEAYVRASIYEILSDETLTDFEKEAYLKTMFEKHNASEVLKAYDNNARAKEIKQSEIDKAQEVYNKAKEKYNNKTNKKAIQSYEPVKTPGQEGYSEQKSQVQIDPYGKRKNLTAENIQKTPTQSGTVVSSSGSPYSAPGSTVSAEEAAEVLELYNNLMQAERSLQETKDKDAVLYDLYEILYGNKS